MSKPVIGSFVDVLQGQYHGNSGRITDIDLDYDSAWYLVQFTKGPDKGQIHYVHMTEVGAFKDND